MRRLIQERTGTGSLDPKTPDRSGTRKLDEDDREQLRKLIKDKPDMTLGELAAALNGKASVPTVWRAAEAMGLTLKKTMHASEQDRPDGQGKARPLVRPLRGREAGPACFP